MVVVDFRALNPAAGVRPALTVQNDADNERMRNTVVVQITSNTARVDTQTQLLIDPGHHDWNRSGLRQPSAINYSSIYTIDQGDVAKVIGSLSAETVREVDECLKVALAPDRRSRRMMTRL